MTTPAAAPEPLVELDEFEELTSEIEQTRLDQAIADIRSYCGWHIAPVFTETKTLDGPGRSVLLLKSQRVIDVASVRENGRELVEGTDYEWSEAGMLRRRCGWTDRYRGVVVEFTHGYDVVPAELVALIFDVATAAAAVPVGERREKIGPFELGGATVEFEPHQYAILDRYRIRNGPA